MSIDSIIEDYGRFATVTGAVALYLLNHQIAALALVLLIVTFTFKSSQNYITQEDVVLITGGADGLGDRLVKCFVRRGVRKVIVLDKNPKVSTDTVKYWPCDVGNETQIKTILGDIITSLEKENLYISVCVNNAGVRHNQSLLTLSSDEIHNLFNVNTLGPIWVIQTVLNNHIQHVLPNDSAAKLSLVTISSVLGYLGPKNLSVYSATKAALIQIHESLAVEIDPYKLIGALLVVPGQLNTKMFGDVVPSRTFFAPILEQRDFAEKIVNRINSRRFGVYCAPLYANFMPLVKVLPLWVQKLCRHFSQMDQKVKDCTETKSIETKIQ